LTAAAAVKVHPLPTITRTMRQLWHKCIGLLFWGLLALLWFLLIREQKAGPSNISYSVQYLAIVTGAVLAITFWWIRHNTSIYRRKGPRMGRPEIAPRLDEDRLGRPIRWQLDGGADEALATGHLVIELDGAAKVYREAV
jgi:hypothetical protein